MEKVITCIICPIGCSITVNGEGERIDSLCGNKCKRGEEYAKNEFVRPVRILTSSALVSDAEFPLVPLRSSKPLPKDMIFDCMEEVKKLNLKAPVRRGDVLIENVLGTGVDIVATGTVEK